MVRTMELRSLHRRILRFTTPGRPGAAAACYVALWITTTGLPPVSHQNLSRRTIRVLGSNLYFTRIFVEAARLVGDFAFDVIGAQSSITEQ